MTDTNNFQDGRVEDSGPNCPASPQPSPEAGVAPSGGRNRGMTWLDEVEAEQDIECSHCTDGCERCSARHLPLKFTDEDSETAVFRALGAASVCWDENGVFQSERAEAIGHELIEHLRKLRLLPAAALSAAPVEYQWGVRWDEKDRAYDSERDARQTAYRNDRQVLRRTVGEWEVVSGE